MEATHDKHHFRWSLNLVWMRPLMYIPITTQSRDKTCSHDGGWTSEFLDSYVIYFLCFHAWFAEATRTVKFCCNYVSGRHGWRSRPFGRGPQQGKGTDMVMVTALWLLLCECSRLRGIPRFTFLKSQYFFQVDPLCQKTASYWSLGDSLCAPKTNVTWLATAVDIYGDAPNWRLSPLFIYSSKFSWWWGRNPVVLFLFHAFIML